MNHWSIGDIVNDRFELKAFLGKGAFAVAWHALDVQTGRQCVLKLHPSDSPSALLPQYRTYLQTIQKQLGSIQDPALDLPYEFGEFSGWQYQLSAYYENFQSLDQVLLSSGPLHPREALNILSKIMDAVRILHSHDVIHADLKPSNILVSDTADREVHITDLGMVQPAETEDSVLVFGIFRYMHPELAASTREGIVRVNWLERPGEVP